MPTPRMIAGEIAKGLFDGRDMDWVRKNKACIKCGAPFYASDGPRRREDVREDEWKPGLIYSDAGMREVNITGMCEFCFDNLFAE